MEEIWLGSRYGSLPLDEMAFWWVAGAISIGVAIYLFRRHE